MRLKHSLSVMYGVVFFTLFAGHLYATAKPAYPNENERTVSKGNITYYINPANGDDQASGTKATQSWKTFAPLNKLILSAGDKVEVAPGIFHGSLVLMARGSKNAHVNIHFAPGDHHFYRDGAFKTKLNITNTNDVPDSLKAIALYIRSSQFIDIKGNGARLLMHGKLIETFVDHGDHITISGLIYDYFRPTVSELVVKSIGNGFADLDIHPDSWYSIRDSSLIWEGEGWRCKPISLWQIFNPLTGEVQRANINMAGIKYVKTGKLSVRALFNRNPGFGTGLIYQSRDITRDCTGIFLCRSNNVELRGIQINYMHGMGIVSQFCQNITIDSVQVKPDPRSGRTCAAWADILHFSGCRGHIVISNSYLSAANDDAINIHGTYLRIISSPQADQLQVRFMHKQTYGFDAFSVGDSIGLVHNTSLLQYSTNVVVAINKIDEKNFLLTLKTPIKDAIADNDAVENITWTPDVWIHHNIITRIPTRGILVTTRKKVVIENNRLIGTHSSGITIADDARSWFESGMVKDFTIQKNNFITCGEPVITIEPENTEKGFVHSNISVTDNLFELRSYYALSAKSTSGVLLNNNVFKVADTKKAMADLYKFKDCERTEVSGNKIIP